MRAASGQRWVGRAGFMCVMTAVFARTAWKYQLENAGRILWLDAGYLCGAGVPAPEAHAPGTAATGA